LPWQRLQAWHGFAAFWLCRRSVMIMPPPDQ
jgi:hypothetical protein